ncbi:recombinase family protein [Pseudoflavonifractor sp. 524-17]|uniref:recombinase family protein n=1 Tax=Pseudoflavonifractor sp. 524-17 TaxID=2304577 RepID=UPI00137A8331|nr:recombinase family protein [Pseudoflavonifractor sp. 524-17]NCE64632.1 recombinase family protein [Pseudoflavonifractor sp. 524-17]
MAIVLYARKSVERENSISCETQLEYCRSVIKPDERDEKIITFVDNGFSGGNVNRDGFQKMIKMVRQGKVKKVIVYKLDRISRSLSDFVNILQEFKEHKVEFVSSQESFDTSSPYGEMIVKLLMVFAEFERTSIINRVTQAYAHRSEMGFYMGGRQPYGFELVPTVIHNVKTKKLNPIPAEVEQVRYIFEVYAQESISLRRLLDILVAEGKQPLNGSSWTTAKLSTLLKNPIYVKADSDVYDYYDRHGVQMVTDVSLFTGEYGAQLYGHTKHDPDAPDWSDMKLVLLTHYGIVDSDIWLKCQRKLEKNRQIGNSVSNPTSWLAGKVVCEKCGHTMTTIKGKINKSGEIRRYFNCTGRSHKKTCTGPNVTIYAEDLENMVYECISEKLADLKEMNRTTRKGDTAEVNELKLKIKAIEKSEKQLLDTMLAGGFNDDLLALANQKATQLKRDRMALYERIEDLKSREDETDVVVNLAKSWRTADYKRKKSVAMIMIHKIVISEDGSTKVLWNI